jgi:hypothetical protein
LNNGRPWLIIFFDEVLREPVFSSAIEPREIVILIKLCQVAQVVFKARMSSSLDRSDVNDAAILPLHFSFSAADIYVYMPKWRSSGKWIADEFIMALGRVPDCFADHGMKYQRVGEPTSIVQTITFRLLQRSLTPLFAPVLRESFT